MVINWNILGNSFKIDFPSIRITLPETSSNYTAQELSEMKNRGKHFIESYNFLEHIFESKQIFPILSNLTKYVFTKLPLTTPRGPRNYPEALPPNPHGASLVNYLIPYEELCT